MDKKLGDWEIEKDLLAICVIASSGIPIKEKGLYGEIVKVILADRKHQKSEMLKRLPSVKKMSKILDEMRIDDEDPIMSDFEENELEIAKAIHKLAEDKLK